MPNKQKNALQRVWDSVKPSFMAKNTIGSNLLTVPLLNNKRLETTQDFGTIYLNDDEYYKGYLFAAIRTRAKRVAQLATEHLKTQKKDDLDAVDHPYLTLIDTSPTFSNFFFWDAISTYIDLKGVAYLLAVRNFNDTKFGSIQQLKLLSPYNITKVINRNGEVGGYVETKNGFYREIPKEMVIEIHNLNPFDLGEGYPMIEAAKDSHYLHRQSSAFTRSALKKNVGQRGLITTEVILENEDFENFKNRVRESGGINGAGDFLFGNGPGSIDYTDMQVDLEKLALEKISNVSVQELLAIAGVSKTTMGIEVSGTTRETGKVQTDLLDRQHCIPQLQLIIDALNQDYRNNYKSEFESNPSIIYIDSPLKTDREAEKTDAETLKLKAEAAKVLIEAGFDPTQTLVTVGIEDIAVAQAPEVTEQGTDDGKEHVHHHHTNAGPLDKLLPIVRAKETSLANDIVNVDRQLLQAVTRKIEKNSIDTNKLEVEISVTETRRIQKQLADVLNDFAQSMISMFGNHTMRKRIEQFGLIGVFRMNNDVSKFIIDHSKLAAASHVDSVLKEIYKVAQEAAEAGLGRTETVSKLNNLFSDKISQARATRIARTEANRTSSEAQYQSDAQFIEQNDLKDRAYKKWTTRSDSPCAYCLKLASEPPIPFFDAFRKVGESIDVVNEDRQQSLVMGYEDIESGTAHPNCSCVYEIVFIKG